MLHSYRNLSIHLRGYSIDWLKYEGITGRLCLSKRMRLKNCFIYDIVTSAELVNTYNIADINGAGAMIEEGHGQNKGRIIN